MSIRLLTTQALHTIKFTKTDYVICIATEQEHIPAALEQATNTMLLEFDDLVPEETVEDNVATLQDIARTIEIHKEGYSNIYIYAATSPSRSLAVLIGLLAVGATDFNNVLYEAVKQCRAVLPNEWIVALYDFYLELDGKLTTVVADYSVTGLVINSVGRSLEATFAV